MKRMNLISARLQAGYCSQKEFSASMRDEGYSISDDEYANIENGRKKEVGLSDALAISRKLGREQDIQSLFLPLLTYKIRQDEPCATLPQTG